MNKHDSALLEAVARVLKDYVTQRLEPLQQQLLDKQAQIDRLAARYEELVLDVARLERRSQEQPRLRTVNQ